MLFFMNCLGLENIPKNLQSETICLIPSYLLIKSELIFKNLQMRFIVHIFDFELQYARTFPPGSVGRSPIVYVTTGLARILISVL